MKKNLFLLFLLICTLMLFSCQTEHKHEWGEWKTTVAADCEHAGSRERACSCGETEVEEIAATGHSFDNGKTVAATTARHGYTIRTCTACAVVEKTDVVSPLGSVGLEYKVNDDKKTCTVTGIGTCTDTELGIPDSIDGYEVTAIGEYAFRQANTLTYVWLGNNVKKLDFGAFDFCRQLQEVVCGEHLETIGAAAFSTCLKLRNVEFSDSITKIERDAFSHCNRLVTLDFGANLQTIEYSAFASCRSLIRVTLPKNLNQIGKEAFYNCNKLVEVINHSSMKIKNGSSSNGMVGNYALTVHDGESKIVEQGDFFFFEREPISYLLAYKGTNTDLVLPENFKGQNYLVYDYAFVGQNGLTSVVIPQAAISFGTEAFQSCTKLEKVEISNLTAWCKTVFSTEGSNPLCYAEKLYLNGELLVNVSIPEGIETVQPYAFVNCKDLQYVILPASVKSIRSNAFKGCSLNGDSYYAGSATEWNRVTMEKDALPTFCVTYYYSETKPETAVSNYWRYVGGVPTRWE